MGIKILLLAILCICFSTVQAANYSQIFAKYKECVDQEDSFVTEIQEFLVYRIRYQDLLDEWYQHLMPESSFNRAVRMLYQGEVSDAEQLIKGTYQHLNDFGANKLNSVISDKLSESSSPSCIALIPEVQSVILSVFTDTQRNIEQLEIAVGVVKAMKNAQEANKRFEQKMQDLMEMQGDLYKVMGQ